MKAPNHPLNLRPEDDQEEITLQMNRADIKAVEAQADVDAAAITARRNPDIVATLRISKTVQDPQAIEELGPEDLQEVDEEEPETVSKPKARALPDETTLPSSTSLYEKDALTEVMRRLADVSPETLFQERAMQHADGLGAIIDRGVNERRKPEEVAGSVIAAVMTYPVFFQERRSDDGRVVTMLSVKVEEKVLEGVSFSASLHEGGAISNAAGAWGIIAKQARVCVASIQQSGDPRFKQVQERLDAWSHHAFCASRICASMTEHIKDQHGKPKADLYLLNETKGALPDSTKAAIFEGLARHYTRIEQTERAAFCTQMHQEFKKEDKPILLGQKQKIVPKLPPLPRPPAYLQRRVPQSGMQGPQQACA